MDKSIQKKSTINSLLTWLVYREEKIPHNCLFFKFIKFNHIDPDSLKPTAASFRDEELSCDWDKYATPEQTRALIGKQFIKGSKTFKNPLEYFVCSLDLSKLLDLDPKQKFEHNPIFHFPPKKGDPNNRAHSLIVGKKDQKDKLKARGQLVLRSKWVIFNEEDFRNLLKEKI